MNVEQGIERRLTDFYASEGAMRAPDRVLTASLSTIETTQQRRVYGVPWRLPRMNTYARLAVAGAAVIAVVAVGLYVLAGNQPAIGPDLRLPRPRRRRALRRRRLQGDRVAAAELTQRFTSTIYGLSVSYPAGWAARVAVTPMRQATPPLSRAVASTSCTSRNAHRSPLGGYLFAAAHRSNGQCWMTARPGGMGLCRLRRRHNRRRSRPPRQRLRGERRGRGTAGPWLRSAAVLVGGQPSIAHRL